MNTHDGHSHPMIRAGRFWLVQLIVWSAFATLEILESIEFYEASGLAIDMAEIVTKAMIPTLLGFAITSIFRLIFVRIQHLDEKRFVIAAIAACLVGSVVFAVAHFEMKHLLGIYEGSQLLNWRKWMSYAPSRLVILGAWTAVYVALVFISETQQARQRMRALETAAAKARSEMLRYQVNPHLLFNALNTVSGHVLNKDTASADKAIQSLSDLLRFSLSDDDSTSISLEQEINRVRLYLAVEQTRYGDELKTSFSIPAPLLGIQLPPFLLQPLVENAMKHGIAKSGAGGEISIHATKGDGGIRIVVRNEMPECSLGERHQEPPVSFGVGLKNVAERLTMFYGEQARLEVIEDTPRSFAIRISFPSGETK